MDGPPPTGARQLGRRRFLTSAIASVAGVAVALGQGARGPEAAVASPATPVARHVVPFYGTHQAGIATPAPSELLFAAYDLAPDVSAADLRHLLQQWTVAAARLTQGEPVEHDAIHGPPATAASTVPGAGDPAGLTLTFGVGPRVFAPSRGLAHQRPRRLVAMPRFPHDELDPARSDGDLGVQACADDPTVLFHAVRVLTSLAEGIARPRWMQRGFGATTNTRATGETPRNLQGFKDGTANSLPTDPEFPRIVWLQPDDAPAWLRDGSYLVVRRIRMHLDRWGTLPVAEQERVIGRAKDSGAPLSGGAEHDPVDFAATGSDGAPLVPTNSHVRLTHPTRNFDARMFRRGYSYDNGWDPTANGGAGEADAGLFFLAYVRDPSVQFIRFQSVLSRSDALTPFVTPVGSALFAILPGVAEGDYVGRSLFV